MTIDYIKKFNDGETIEATDTNNNNDYILDKITDTASTLNTRINSVNTNVSSQIETTKKELIGQFIHLPSSGNVELTTNSIYTITPSNAVTFVLPDVSAGESMNQILVQVNLTNVVSIDVGTTNYFNNKIPDLSKEGKYNLIFEYDELGDVWVCGWMRKG